MRTANWKIADGRSASSRLTPLALAVVLLGGLTASASAYECKSQPEGVAITASTSGTGMAQGKAAWTSKVKGKFGLAWSVWTIAAAPQQSCTPAAGGFQCVTLAKPCKYVVP